MKTHSKYLLLAIIFTCAAISCNKKNDKVFKLQDVSIIGVDPCTSHYLPETPHRGKGYVLLLNSTKDTVVTYNLPDALAKQIDANLQLKDNYLLIPEAVVKTQLAVRPATKNELEFPLCNGMILTAGFAIYAHKQVIIE